MAATVGPVTLDRRVLVRASLFALPVLALAVAGLFHPQHLTADTAARWTMLHVAGLFVFPLVAVALVLLVSGRSDAVAWLVRLTAFVYATAYSALDVISGIGAGYVTWRLDEGASRPDEVRSLFMIGGRLGEVGSWALIGCAVIVAVDAVRRRGLVAAPGILLVPGAVLVHSDHIFAPVGVLGMALIGLASGWLAAMAVEPTTAGSAPSHRGPAPTPQPPQRTPATTHRQGRSQR